MGVTSRLIAALSVILAGGGIVAAQPPARAPQTGPAPAAAAPAVDQIPPLFDVAFGAGLFWNEYATPQLSGDAFVAKLESKSAGLYSYTEFIFTSSTDAATHKWTLAQTPTTGQAVYLRSIAGFKVFADGTVGASMAATSSGTKTGLGLSGGGFAVRRIGSSGFFLLLAAQAISVEAAKGRASQFQYGLNLGWGSDR